MWMWDHITGPGLGRPFAPPAVLSHHIWDRLPTVASDDARGEGEDAPYGPAIEIPSDAPLPGRLVAFTGRDPRWQASTSRWRQAG